MQAMRARPTSLPGVGRRTLVTSGALALVAALGACGVRLEEDAPDLPLIPRRPELAGEALLLDLVIQALTLAAAATVNGSDLGRALEPLHRTQASVLQDALLRGGVPTTVVTRAVRGVPAPPTTVTDADLAAAERGATTDTGRYAALAPELARPVLALLAQRHAAASLLAPGDAGSTPSGALSPTPSPEVTGTPSTSPSPSPSPSATEDPAEGSDDATAAVETLRGALTAALEAVHAFEVIQARSPKDAGAAGVRERAAASALWLRSLAETWTRELGPAAPEAPIAIALPLPLTTPDEATALAAEMLTRVRSALGRHLAALDGVALTSAWSSLPATLADVEVHAHGWGAALEAFPGLP